MSDFRCPGCGQYWASLAEFTRSGGEVYSAGLALKGICVCGMRFAVGQYWEKTQVIDLRGKKEDEYHAKA